MTTATEQETRVFVTGCPDLILTRRPGRPERQLADGTYSMGVEPLRVTFEGVTYATNDEDTIAWLRSHKLFNTPQGFTEVGAGPEDLLPSIPDCMTAIATASARQDIDALLKIELEESETHNRAIVIETVNSALVALTGDQIKEA